MAGVVRPMAAAMKPLSFSAGSKVAQRSFASVAKKQESIGGIRAQISRRQDLVARECRRGYADLKPTVEGTKRKGWRVLRWTWRITYLSLIGGLAYGSYGIYVNRHPIDQQAPDPNKKTLVVLGKRACCDYIDCIRINY